MNISKANAATLGHILADALHNCNNLAERKGVLRAKDAILDVLEGDCQRSDADWQRYCAFGNRFDDRLNHLEPLTNLAIPPTKEMSYEDFCRIDGEATS
tara:strand:- start:501 stop:797 length:297 start_codon:yes stop_codon:yes gene_type:complete